MKEHDLSFDFQARYYTQGNRSESVRHIWFVLHGYGQLAQYFLRKFDIPEADNSYFIAPEGLSRFYLEDITSRSQSGNQRVGATWMTRENRLMDIRNYITYLNALYQKEVYGMPHAKITICGFSQGASTATRWAMDGSITFDQLVLWAGIFPSDIDLKRSEVVLNNKEVIEVFGNQDPYVTDEKLNEATQIHARLGIQPRVIRFEGGHEIHEPTLAELLN